MLGCTLIVYKTILANQCTAVTPAKTVKGRLTLNLDVTKHGVNIGNLPTKFVGLYRDVYLGMLREVDALDFLKQVLACKEKCGLRNVLASEEHLGKSDELLVCPLALVLQLTLELPTHTLCEVDILHTQLRNVHLELALATCPKGTVATNLEVRNGLLGNQCLSEWDALLLRVKVVRDNLIHTTLLKIYTTWLWNNEVWVYLLLCLIKCI